MKGFTPYKRHANEFKYTPRFYDPAKEERDRRRAELRGSRPEGAEDEDEYIPGEYIRRQREARDSRRAAKRGGRPKSMMTLVMVVAIIFLIAYMILPRLIGAFMSASSNVERVEPANEYEAFDPYAPIRIVPNDHPTE